MPVAPQGIGIGLRREHYDAILETTRRVDWLEFVPENFIDRDGKGPRALRACAERWPMIPHGVSVSLGGPDPLDRGYLRRLRELLDAVDAPYYSDHLCYTAIDGETFHDLLPLPFSEEAVEHVAARIRMVADILERPVVVENITYYAEMPGSRLGEGEFVGAVLERADCHLLLDLNNVYVNAINHRRDPLQALWALPVERTCHVHLAGYSIEPDGRLLDDHGSKIDSTVLEMYAQFVGRTGPVSTLLEWDTRVPALDDVLDEADRARAVLSNRLQRPTRRTIVRPDATESLSA
jgi:hypothetical protein